MQARDVALDHYADRAQLVDAAAQLAAQAWGRVDPDRILESWLAQLPDLTVAVSAAQAGVAAAADGYLDEVLDAQGLDTAAAGSVRARAFAGVASDGRPLGTLLANPAIATLSAIADGVDIAQAMATGRSTLDMMVRTQVADAGRAADQVAMTARRSANGYVRVAVGKSCARCMILAGRTYRWNDGFPRHPRCDCIHLPTEIAKAGKLEQDPEAMYARMSATERTRAGFTKGDQAAIANGADINAVVNAHRGLYTTTVGGRRIQATREGTTVRGLFGRFEVDGDGRLRERTSAELESRRFGSRHIRAARAPRLTPEQIYRIAGDNRAEAVRLLRRNGYIFGRGTAAPVRVDPLAAYRQRAAAAATGAAALTDVPINLARGVPTLLPGRKRTFAGGLGLTSEQLSFLRQYKGTAYSNINDVLRLRKGDPLPDTFGFAFYREATKAIDIALQRSKLPTDVLVFRGIGDGAAVFGGAWDRPLVGAEWTEWAYMSTSTDEAVARDPRFHRPGQGAIMRILAPKGTGGVVLSDGSYESEILLERGLRLRVVSDTGPGPDRVIELEIVP